MGIARQPRHIPAPEAVGFYSRLAASAATVGFCVYHKGSAGVRRLPPPAASCRSLPAGRSARYGTARHGAAPRRTAPHRAAPHTRTHSPARAAHNAHPPKLAHNA